MQFEQSAPTLTRLPAASREMQPADGIDGAVVGTLLQGAAIKGVDPLRLLRSAGINPAVYCNPRRTIDGPALVRLVRQIQSELDDVYLGFLPQGCRLALEAESVDFC